MVRRIEDDIDDIDYYYDSHPTEEDLMGESAMHSALVHYLVDVLHWLFHDRLCAIYENLNFYHTPYWKEYPLAPDIAVITGIDFRYVQSWRVGKSGPPPHVVFEIASKETWKKDINEKPLKYAHIGVREYILYDPNAPRLWHSPPGRLRVWQWDDDQQNLLPVQLNTDGRAWSSHLESWLVPDGYYLRLYDQRGQRRLTQAEERDRLAEKLRSLGIDPDQV